MSDKKSLLGSFCREESPKLCDHALLSNATRATRPCAPSESYITTGPALTILQVTNYTIQVVTKVCDYITVGDGNPYNKLK